MSAMSREEEAVILLLKCMAIPTRTQYDASFTFQSRDEDLFSISVKEKTDPNQYLLFVPAISFAERDAGKRQEISDKLDAILFCKPNRSDYPDEQRILNHELDKAVETG